MVDVIAVWKEALPEVRRGVTGVGIWTALNASRPITIEDGVFVLGLPHEETKLAGHLRLPQTRRLIEQEMALRINQRVTLRVIDGDTLQDWDMEKRRDAEKRRLQELAIERAKAESSSRSTWETIYEQLSRRFANTPNRSLPQNRAKFLIEATDILVEGLVNTPITDDLAERNYARCIERVAQYAELPSALVALRVLERTFGRES